MTSKPYKLSVHALFAEHGVNPDELLLLVDRFLEGDCGDLTGEDQILGFMDRSLRGNARYAVYDTPNCGRVHIMAKDPEITVVPDLIYATEYESLGPELNLCNCSVCSSSPETQLTPTTHYGNS